MGQILIEVKASSVNPLDSKICCGRLSAIAPEMPAILHGDVAGDIVEVGEAVDDINVGDEVYACAGDVTGRQGGMRIICWPRPMPIWNQEKQPGE